MRATRTLPTNYRHQATLDLSKSRIAVVGAIVFGIVLLITVGWLLVQYARLVRPAAFKGPGIPYVLTVTPEGNTAMTLPFLPILVALVLVMLIHELVHGLFYWGFAGQRPRFGIKGPSVYVAAPPEVFFPRDQYLMVGIAPFVLLTLGGLLLMIVVPVAVLPTVMLFVAFNAAGAAGDLMMFARLLRFSSDTLMQDRDTGVRVYGPDRVQRAA